MKTRLDAELVRRGLARSRDVAVELIEGGKVLVTGIRATKAATQVDAQTSITLADEQSEYVSRGGHKLVGALDSFSQLNVKGKTALDAGASTGGFTDVLLKRGVVKVVAVDLVALKERIAAINTTDISTHSAEFSRVHELLQQALTNLDGV